MDIKRRLKMHRMGNRLSGLARGTLGGIVTFGTEGFGLEDVAGTMFMIEGLGDLLSGDHHYASSRIIKYLSRGKINITYDCNKYAK